MMGMGGDGAEEKVTDKSRAERGRDLQPQLKSKRRGGNPGDTQTEAEKERQERGFQEERAVTFKVRSSLGIRPPGHWLGARQSQGRRQRQFFSTVSNRSCFPWDFRPKSAENSQGPGTRRRRRARGQGRWQVWICGTHQDADKEETHWAMVVGATALNAHTYPPWSGRCQL